MLTDARCLDLWARIREKHRQGSSGGYAAVTAQQLIVYARLVEAEALLNASRSRRVGCSDIDVRATSPEAWSLGARDFADLVRLRARAARERARREGTT